MTTPYRLLTEIPPLVAGARAAAERLGFAHSCTPEVGRLLRTLAAQVGAGPVGEVGTGCGYGAAWLLSGLRPGIPFVTVELDEARSAAARDLLSGRPEARVLTGDWKQILAHGPFRLLFVDTKAKEQEPETVLEALAPGGLVVLDDLTPAEFSPEEWRGRPDPQREFWLGDPRLAATEIRLTARTAAILAVRVP